MRARNTLSGHALSRHARSGQALVEFALVGIPLIFLIISTFEMARGMWCYQTLAYALRVGARYASLHGAGCSANGSACSIQVSDVAHAIADAAVGIPASDLSITLTSATAAAVNCAPISNCYGNSATWPPAADNAVGKDISISGTWTFTSAIAMMWPGAGADAYGSFKLGAWTKQSIQF